MKVLEGFSYQEPDLDNMSWCRPCTTLSGSNIMDYEVTLTGISGAGIVGLGTATLGNSMLEIAVLVVSAAAVAIRLGFRRNKSAVEK